jgi:hypothetical protein
MYSGIFSSAVIDFKVYRYKYIFNAGNKIKTGQMIFLNPIINQGDITFQFNNNVIYADIKGISLGFITCIYNRLKFRQM